MGNLGGVSAQVGFDYGRPPSDWRCLGLPHRRPAHAARCARYRGLTPERPREQQPCEPAGRRELASSHITCRVPVPKPSSAAGGSKVRAGAGHAQNEGLPLRRRGQQHFGIVWALREDRFSERFLDPCGCRSLVQRLRTRCSPKRGHLGREDLMVTLVGRHTPGKFFSRS